MARGDLFIRRASAQDDDGIWAIFEPVVREGASYPVDPHASRDEAMAYWHRPELSVYVAEIGNTLVGVGYHRANQEGPGSHIANGGFAVHPQFRGQGIARDLAKAVMEEARRAGFTGMQFNLVVSTNRAAIAAWQSVGFTIIGTVPGAFRHHDLGLVDAHIMYRDLEPGLQS